VKRREDAIDLGGTSFRIIKLELSSGMVINKKVEHQPIPPEELTKGTIEVYAITLFPLLARCIVHGM
jgi:hexokinase